MRPILPEAPRVVEVVQVIHVQYLIGEGIEGDPARLVDRYYTLDGHLLAEQDTHRDRHPAQKHVGPR